MPKRTNLKSILVLGAGPIVIGQACEFDYAGTQGCLALKEEGYRVILVNSNPATIMTDPALCDATYIEPMTAPIIRKIIEKERPDALLPTLGGQTALNLAMELDLEELGVALIGTSRETIQKAEERQRFSQTMKEAGLDVPLSILVKNKKEAQEAAQSLSFPIIIRPSFALGGHQAGIAYNLEELLRLFDKAGGEVLLDEGLIGWKEFEMEVMRDEKDTCIAVCTMENIDPLGIHTGDSITVAPQKTLTDKEYQKMRNAAFAVIRAVGVKAGGANVQFAVHPKSGKMVVIEMNPRLSRSSALASKATGFPIAKIAAKLAVGYTLEECMSCLEPTLDYVVVKIPKFQFEKFPKIADRLGPQMQSVGEVMAIGRTFSEALLKAMRSVEPPTPSEMELSPNSKRLWHLFEAFRLGKSLEDVHSQTLIDFWFLNEIQMLVQAEIGAEFTSKSLLELKRLGFSDAELGPFFGKEEREIRKEREERGIKPVFKEAAGSSIYSTYEPFCEANPSPAQKVMILGSGANRIGQGIEFDYSCVHAVFALKEMGYETIMVNCNPSTVSTDFDCADKLYFSPLTIEDLLPIIKMEKPLGVLLQFGGQTPLNLALELEENGVNLLGFHPSLVETCENRSLFRALLHDLSLKQPENQTLSNLDDSMPDHFPVIVRPSFVLGGGGMATARDRKELTQYLEKAFQVAPHHPVLVERHLKDAIEIDVDVIADGENVWIPSIMQQVEMAGIHSGDSASYLPSLHLTAKIENEIIQQTEKIARKLGIKGVFNIQFAVESGFIYVLEVNPRASRSLPFLSKAIGEDLVRKAIRCIMGFPLEKASHQDPEYFFVKEAVMPTAQFGEIELGPEMKSIGEVMGIGSTYEEAYLKAQVGAGYSEASLDSYEVRSLQEIDETLFSAFGREPRAKQLIRKNFTS